MAEITQVFEISVEHAGDYIFIPAGILIIYQQGRFKVFSESAQHNFLRRTISRYPWPSLLNTVVENGTSVRLKDILDEIEHKNGFSALSTETVLEICYEANPRQLFFLQRYLSDSPSHTNMPPS